MGKGRLEAFSDGVIAIIITIMVLELEVPHDVSFASLAPLLPVLLSYVLSFVYVGIYWNSHHHMLAACHRVSGAALWANLHLLFWLSLFPFTTAWMGENHFAAAPTAVYGGVLLMAALAYWLLQGILMRIAAYNASAMHGTQNVDTMSDVGIRWWADHSPQPVSRSAGQLVIPRNGASPSVVIPAKAGIHGRMPWKARVTGSAFAGMTALLLSRDVAWPRGRRWPPVRVFRFGVFRLFRKARNCYNSTRKLL